MSDDLKVIRLKEYEKIETGDITDEQARALSELTRYIGVRRAFDVSDGFELEARQYVGTIVVDGLKIVIEPKVPVTNLFYMLTFAYDLPDFRQRITSLGVSSDIFEFIVEIFLHQVESLVKKGIYRSYVESEQNDRYLRGRLLLTSHLRKNAASRIRMFQRQDRYTADVLENQVLKRTFWVLTGLSYQKQGLSRVLRRVLTAFAEVSHVPVRPSDCDRIVYTRLNSSYRQPVHLARLLLQNLSVEWREGKNLFFTFLLDMNKVFELYVARYLEKHFEIHSDVDVEIQPTIWLDEGHKEKGRPDIILRLSRKRSLVLDTKYKDCESAPGENDRNQMLVYCHAMGIPRGVLIYASPYGLNYRRKFKEISLSAVSLPLDGGLTAFQRRSEEFAVRIVEIAEQDTL